MQKLYSIITKVAASNTPVWSMAKADGKETVPARFTRKELFRDRLSCWSIAR